MHNASLTALDRANFKHLYQDILWFGVLNGSTLAFLAIFAARVGATSLQVSLITALPALVNLAFSLHFGRWIEGRNLIGVSVWSAALHRLGYLALIPLPWLLPAGWQVWALLAITLAMSFPSTPLAIGFNALYSVVVPPDQRGEVTGRRNAILAITMTITTLLAGQILDRVEFPFNYQVVFAIGALGAAMSTYHVSRLRLPSSQANSPSPAKSNTEPRAKKPLLRPDLLRSSFGLFLLSCLVFYTFQYIPLPLFPLFAVHDLELSDGTISLASSLFYLVMFLTSMQLGRLSRKFSHKQLLAWSAIGFSIYPLLLGVSWDEKLYLLASVMGGIMWAIVGASLLNRLMEHTPDEERPAYMTLHNLVFNLGIFTGSLLAPWLANSTDLRTALLIAAGLRALAGVLFLAWG